MNFNEYPIESLMFITNRPEIVFTHGKGSWLYDNNGKRYLDFIQGWAVNSLGHCNDGMIEALNKQAQPLLNPSPAFYNEPMAKLAGSAHAAQLLRQGVLREQRRRSERRRDQARAQVGQEVQGRRVRNHHVRSQLPRPHARHHVRQRQAGLGHDLRTASAGLSESGSERHRVGRKAHQREDRRRDARADPGRRRRDSRHARIHAATARADEEAQPAPDRR